MKEIQKQGIFTVLKGMMKVLFTMAIKNEFRKCRLYPFNSENVDVCANAVKTPFKIVFLNFKEDCLMYLKSKIENYIPKEFKEKYHQGKKRNRASHHVF